MCKEFTTHRELVGHHVLDTKTTHDARVVTDIRAQLRSPDCAVDQRAAKVIATAQLGAQNVVDIDSPQRDVVARLPIQFTAHDKLTKVIVIPAVKAVNGFIILKIIRICRQLPDAQTSVSTCPVAAQHYRGRLYRYCHHRILNRGIQTACHGRSGQKTRAQCTHQDTSHVISFLHARTTNAARLGAPVVTPSTDARGTTGPLTPM